MTRIRIIRDIVIPVADGTHTIQRGTCYYIPLREEEIVAGGAPLRVPARPRGWSEDVWLFVGEDIEIVEDPIPF
tara:strand:+ start:478 stop:699 length:222 start_codon:yes stop_codon:yes gene_type:complete